MTDLFVPDKNFAISCHKMSVWELSFIERPIKDFFMCRGESLRCLIGNSQKNHITSTIEGGSLWQTLNSSGET